MNFIINLDTRLFLLINGWHSETFDAIMWWVSGKITWWPFYLLLLMYLAWTKRWQLVLMLLFVVLTVTLTDQSSVHLFKRIFIRLRPCHEPALEGMVHIVNGKCGGMYGFISSHAANVFGITIMLLLWVRKWWFSTVMVTWATLVCYSRIYLGVHYPGDVICGALWGALCGWLMFLLFKFVIRKLPEQLWITQDKSVKVKGKS